MTDSWFVPEWPAPANVKAFSTTRLGGVSDEPFNHFNLALHVGDDPQAVMQNRQMLQEGLQLPAEPRWLQQVHGCDLVDVATAPIGVEADGSYSTSTGAVCVVMTADCLPVLMTNKAGTCVAAVHAGWRGLLNGILEHMVSHLPVASDELLVWLGPAIGPQAFEVGQEVREAFCQVSGDAAHAFVPRNAGHWLADLYLLARQRLQGMGVQQIYGGDFCTYTDRERFYSFRRDGVCGRMASLIWLDKAD